jgi:hypothetical protein
VYGFARKFGIDLTASKRPKGFLFLAKLFWHWNIIGGKNMESKPIWIQKLEKLLQEGKVPVELEAEVKSII